MPNKPKPRPKPKPKPKLRPNNHRRENLQVKRWNQVKSQVWRQ